MPHVRAILCVPEIGLCNCIHIQGRGATDFTQPENLERAMITTNSVVALDGTHEQAEDAIKKLQQAGVDIKSLSIATQE